jgi:beta-lactamase regulating signal transducer with metallopeptidase domain
LSKTVSRRHSIGVIGLIISIATIISIFAYFSFYSNMNIGFIGNNSISNTDLTNHLTDKNHISNLDENTSSILITVWIGLMIAGSYLLYHIHFKVLPKG